MQHCMDDIIAGINNLIKRHNLSKQDVCERFKIKPAKYNDYVKSNYNYSVMDMACLNAAFMELGSRKIKEDVPIQGGW